jgi:hypothetical protein
MKWLAIPILLISQPCFAVDVYQWKDDKGIIHYGDKPKDIASDKVILNEPSVYESNTDYSVSADKSSAADTMVNEAIQYRISLTSPSNQATFRKDGSGIQVSVNVQPAPQSPMVRYRFYLDGTTVTESGSSSLRLENLDRGEHSIRVELVDADGRILGTSTSHVFYLHQPTVKRKAR